MLPDNCRWADTAEGACLYRNYACIAVVRPGRVEIARGRKRAPLPPLVGVCGSIEQGKRHVERWVMARMGPAQKLHRRFPPTCGQAT